MAGGSFMSPSCCQRRLRHTCSLLQDTYPEFLLAALGVGIAGGSFAVGIAYVSKWFPTEKQGTALGVFGAGNVGAAVTKFVAPFVMVAYGWEAVAKMWAGALVVIAILFWLFTKDDPAQVARRKSGVKAQSALLQLEPLRNLQVWRFSLYYFFVFGAFVALALWLPRYLVGVYGFDIKQAGMVAAFYSIPASLFRIYGGHLSDKIGPRKVMYVTFGASMLFLFMLSYPKTDYVIHGIQGPIAFSTEMSIAPFMVAIFGLGFFMSLGKAAVYKHIPVYYPGHVGAVGGLVGMIGGLGGFVLPILFGVMNDLTGVWTSCFMLLFGVVAVAFVWMHLSILHMERKAYGKELEALPEFPEMQEIHTKERGKAISPSSKTGARKTRNSGKKKGGKSPTGICGRRSRRCSLLSPSGWYGASSSPNCRRSGSITRPTSCSGSRRSPASPAQRFGYSIPSWFRSSAEDCGRR